MKLLPREVRAIRLAYAGGATKAQLSEQYGVSEVAIWKMVHGEALHKRAGGPVAPAPTYLDVVVRDAVLHGLRVVDPLFVIGTKLPVSEKNASLPGERPDNEYYAENRGRPPPFGLIAAILADQQRQVHTSGRGHGFSHYSASSPLQPQIFSQALKKRQM